MFATAEGMIQVCRCEPERTLARVRIGNGGWETLTGTELVELWDVPGAATITIDRVYLDDRLALEAIVS